MADVILKKTLELINKSNEPLEIKEIEEKIKIHIEGITRTKIFSRLNRLRGDGLIKGKSVAGERGIWIWWRKK